MSGTLPFRTASLEDDDDGGPAPVSRRQPSPPRPASAAPRQPMTANGNDLASRLLRVEQALVTLGAAPALAAAPAEDDLASRMAAIEASLKRLATTPPAAGGALEARVKQCEAAVAGLRADHNRLRGEFESLLDDLDDSDGGDDDAGEAAPARTRGPAPTGNRATPAAQSAGKTASPGSQAKRPSGAADPIALIREPPAAATGRQDQASRPPEAVTAKPKLRWF